MDANVVRRYWRVVVQQWWWLLILSVLIPAGISYHFASNRPLLYEARVTVLVGSSVFEDPSPDSLQLNISRTLAGAYAELLTQRPVLQAVIDRLGLDVLPEGLAKQISTSISYQAQLLEIRVTDTNPEAAAVIANALADELIRRSPSQGLADPQQQAFIQNQLAELMAKIEDVGSEITELSASLATQTSAAEIRDIQGKIDALEQVRTRYQSTYASLLNVSVSQSTNMLSIFEPAEVPPFSMPRNTKLIVAIAGAAGGALALAAIALMEFLDTTLRWDSTSGHSVQGLPVLGTVPQSSRNQSLLSSNPLSPVAESIRALRSNLFLIRSGRPYKTLLVTSPEAGEGKSFVLANLAVALASTGHRIIAVDADMRRPRLHELFDKPNVNGLADVLADRNGKEKVPHLQETGYENLRLLTSGRSPDDPTALLMSSQFNEVLEILAGEGDIILVDTPPVLGPPDATLIATLMDGTVIVAASGLTKRDMLRQAKERLAAQQGVTLLGVAINRVKRNGSYYYHHYYKTEQAPKQGQGLPEWLTRLFSPEGALMQRVPAWARGVFEDDGRLTVAEAARRLGIGKAQARRWCKSGQLAATKRWVLFWRVDPAGIGSISGVYQGTELQQEGQPG